MNLLFLALYFVAFCAYRRVSGFTVGSTRGVLLNRQSSALAIDRNKEALPSVVALNPFEHWYMSRKEAWYDQSLQIKCPFFRRRTSDLLDALDMAFNFLIIRHKSLPVDLIGVAGHQTNDKAEKNRVLSLEEAIDVIRRDWREDNDKGYYITGRLNQSIYRDDCLFEGPDPDMPVRGLRKYLSAASQLFDYRSSTSRLLSLQIVDDVIVAKWRMTCTLRLPWKPSLPEWTGSTTYHFDEDGLIFLHEEKWDMSVLQAFVTTFLPDLAEIIWPPRKVRKEQSIS